MATNAYVTGIAVVVIPASMTYVTLCEKDMRQSFSIFNNSTGQLHLRFGDDLNTEWSVKIGPDQLYETTNPTYRGKISGKWSNTVGDAHVTVFS